MKKRFLTILVLLLCTSHIQAFESGQLSLDTPTVLKANEAAFTIRHRFYGKVNDVENFFGIDDGGNVMLQLRYAPIDNMLVEIHHTRDNKEYNLGLGYSIATEFINVGLNINLLSMDLVQFENRQNSYFANMNLQTPNYFDHLIITANIAYDGYYESTGLGLGLDFNVANFFTSLVFTERVALVAEYYPQIDKTDGVNGKNDSYAAGIKFQTYGHHFELLVSNSVAMDARNMMLGTNSDDLHFGFNINRKF